MGRYGRGSSSNNVLDGQHRKCSWTGSEEAPRSVSERGRSVVSSQGGGGEAQRGRQTHAGMMGMQRALSANDHNAM